MSRDRFISEVRDIVSPICVECKGLCCHTLKVPCIRNGRQTLLPSYTPWGWAQGASGYVPPKDIPLLYSYDEAKLTDFVGVSKTLCGRTIYAACEYLNPETGCTIPREQRPKTCRQALCRSAQRGHVPHQSNERRITDEEYAALKDEVEEW